MTNNEIDDYIDVTPLTRLGIDVLPGDTFPDLYFVSNNQRRHLNANVMAETGLRIVPCHNPHDANKQAWILLWQYPECIPFWDWSGRNYDELGKYIDPIITSAHRFDLPLLVAVDTVTFADFSDDNRIENPNPPANSDKFREWLRTQYMFTSLGPSPNGRGEIFCLDPEVPPITIPLPAIVKTFFNKIEKRLTEPADVVWFQRELRRVLAEVVIEKKQNDRPGHRSR